MKHIPFETAGTIKVRFGAATPMAPRQIGTSMTTDDRFGWVYYSRMRIKRVCPDRILIGRIHGGRLFDRQTIGVCAEQFEERFGLHLEIGEMIEIDMSIEPKRVVR